MVVCEDPRQTSLRGVVEIMREERDGEIKDQMLEKSHLRWGKGRVRERGFGADEGSNGDFEQAALGMGGQGHKDCIAQLSYAQNKNPGSFADFNSWRRHFANHTIFEERDLLRKQRVS